MEPQEITVNHQGTDLTFYALPFLNPPAATYYEIYQDEQLLGTLYPEIN